MTVRNVVDYGAVGDGVTNDYAAFAAAFAAAASGDTVYVPGSASPYVLGTSLQLRSGVVLLGDGIGASVLRGVYGSAGQAIIKNDWTGPGDSDLTVADLTIDRSGANSGHGIRIQNADTVTLARVAVTGRNLALPQGAIIVGGFAANTVDPTVTDATVEDCEVTTPDNFGIVFGAVIGGRIVGCTVADAYREALGVEPGALNGDPLTASSITIARCTVTFGSTGSGTQTGIVILTTTSGGTLEGVVVEDCTLASLGAIASNTSPGVWIAGTGHTIRRNRITGANACGITVGTAGEAAPGCTIRDNVIIDANSGGHATQANASGIIFRHAATTGGEAFRNRIAGTTTLHTVAGEAAGTAGNRLWDNGPHGHPIAASAANPGTGLLAHVGRTLPTWDVWCLDSVGAPVDLAGATIVASLRQYGVDRELAATITVSLNPSGDGGSGVDVPSVNVAPSAGALDAATPGPAELIVVATAGAAVEEWHFPVMIRT